MAEKIILRFLRPATFTAEEFAAAKARLAANPEEALAPPPGFFAAFAEHLRNIRAGLIWAALCFGAGNLHRNLEFLFYAAGFFLLLCVMNVFRILDSLDNFGGLRDRHRAYYRELAEDIRACPDHEAFHELREGKEAARLYR